MEPPTYAEARKLPFASRPLAAFAAHNPFARDAGGSRPTSPSPSEAGDAVSELKRRRPISRKHVEQAVRLFGETLQEDLASDYAFDLHFSALDYCLKALPELSFEDAPARKANIRRRLSKLLEQVGADGVQSQDTRWWQAPGFPFGGGGGASGPAMSTPAADGSFELLGTCPSCASRVPVHVPAWMANGGGKKPGPASWEELAVAAVVGFAVMIKQSPIPLLITSFFTAMWQAALYLDVRFEVHQRFLLLLGGIIEALVVLDRELGVLRKCGDLVHKSWEISVSAILAFAKAEGYPGPRAGSATQQQPQATTSAPSTSPDFGGHAPALYTTAPTPLRRQTSGQGHAARNSWPNRDVGPAPLATSSSSAQAGSAGRGLRSPASYDTLRHATSISATDGAQTDSDEAGPSVRRRTDSNESWTGRALNLVPGRRG